MTQLDRSLKRAERRLSGSTRRMARDASRLDRTLSAVGRNFGRKLAVSIGALGSALGAATLLRSAENIAKRLDDIGKTADSLGFTTSALQELRAAAADQGVTLSESDVGLRRFVQSIGEARSGTETYAEVFRTLNVALLDSQGVQRSNIDILRDVADGMAEIEDPAERVRLAIDLFGRSGQKFVNLLADGADGLDVLQERARNAGEVIEESLVRAAEDTVTELGRLERQIDTNLANAFGNTQPILVAWKELLRDLSAIAAGTAGQINAVAAAAERAAAATDNGQAGAFRTDGGTVLGSINRNGLDPDDPRRGIIGDFRVRRPAPTAPQLPPNVATPPPGSGGGGGGGGGRGRAEPTARSFAEILGPTSDRIRELQLEVRLLSLSATEAERLRAEYRLIDALVREYGDNLAEAVERGLLPENYREQVTEAARSFAETEAALDRQRDQIERLAAVTAKWREQSEDASRAAAEGFASVADVIGRGIAEADSFGEALKRIGVELLSLGAQGLAGQGPLAGVLGNVFGSIFGGGGRELINPPVIASARGNVISGGRVVPFAKGGVVNGPVRFPMRGATGLMGEAGPEAILPLTRGPGGRLGVAASGSGGIGAITINSPVNITEPNATPEQIRAIVAESERRTIRKIVELNRRDPTVLQT